MNIPPLPHSWQVSPKEAIAIQKRLAPRVDRSPLAGPVRFVAGLDAAFSKAAGLCFAGAVLWDLEKRAVVEEG